MSSYPYRIKSFGTKALLLEWPNNISPELIREISAFGEFLVKNHLDQPKWEALPIYHSLTLISPEKEPDLAAVAEQINTAWLAFAGHKQNPGREWVLPVCYEGDFALDLEEVSSRLKLSPAELIALHCSVSYPVYGIGFLPGFVYLGGVPDALVLPRRESPRLRVPEGSVGLAGVQTGIYPQQSPGGWNIIGNCPIPLFDAQRDPPCFIQIGDTVRFRAVSAAEYELRRIEGQVGIYDFSKRIAHDADN